MAVAPGEESGVVALAEVALAEVALAEVVEGAALAEVVEAAAVAGLEGAVLAAASASPFAPGSVTVNALSLMRFGAVAGSDGTPPFRVHPSWRPE